MTGNELRIKIEQLIIENQLEEAIRVLLGLATGRPELARFRSDAVLLLSAHASLQADQRNGVLSSEQASIAEQTIKRSTLGLLHEVEHNLVRDLSVTGRYPVPLPIQVSVSESITGSKSVAQSPALRVFLCHASADKNMVRDLYQRLKADGLQAWLDEEDLLPGQDWEDEIRQTVRKSDVVLVCLSSHSVAKAGFVQKEIQYALDVADEQPQGRIFIVPVRLENCTVPTRLQRWQWVDLFEESGYIKLWQTLKVRSKAG